MYGVNSASFLALLCLRPLDFKDGANLSLARGFLIKNPYVYDILARVDSVTRSLGHTE